MTDDSSEPILSNDETDALLEVMRAGAAALKEAKDLSLGSSDDRLRSAMARADDVGRLLAPEIKRSFRRLLGMAYGVQEAPADVVPYSVFMSSLGPGSAVAPLRGTDPCCGFITIGPLLTTRVLDRRLGAALGPGGEAGNGRRPLLSAVDRRILRPLCEQLLERFLAHWRPKDDPVVLADILARPSDAPRLSQYEPLLRVPLSIQLSAEASDEVSILITSSLVAGAEAPGEKPTEQQGSVEDRARLAARLTAAEVELTAALGHVQSTVRDVLSLEIGDVIRLNEAPSHPVAVSVEGLRKVLGLPVVNHGNIAIQVTEILRGTV